MTKDESIFLAKLSGVEHSESSEIVLNYKLSSIWIGNQSSVSTNFEEFNIIIIITLYDGESILENCVEKICRYRMIPMKHFVFASQYVSEFLVFLQNKLMIICIIRSDPEKFPDWFSGFGNNG